MKNEIVEIEDNSLADILKYKKLSDFIANKDRIKSDVESYLNKDEFNFLVTEANAVDAKNKISDLNKTTKAFKQTIKPIIERESYEILQVEELSKHIVTLISDKYKGRKQDIEFALEDTYKAREAWIRDYFRKLIDESDVDIDINSFNSCCEANRDKLTWKLKQNGTPNTVALNKIMTEFKVISEPLIEAKLLHDQKQKEQLFLDSVLNKIKTSGTDDELQKSILELRDVDANIDTIYTAIAPEAKRQVSSMMMFVNNSIESNKKYAEVEQAEAKPIWNTNKIRSIFEKPFGMMNLSLEEVNTEIEKNLNYPFDEFEDLAKFARNIATEQLSNLQRIKYAIEKKQAEVPTNQDGYKVVDVKVMLKFRVKKDSDLSKLINKIENEMLNEKFTKAIESIEVD